MALQASLEAARKASKTARITIQNVFELDKKWFRDDVNPEYIALGCAPSINIYGTKGELVTDGRKIRHRFAGYHQHYSPNDTGMAWTPAIKHEAVRMMDAFAGIAGVSLAASIDNPIRRRYYGLAGEVRWPSYGLEWRTLSNFYLCHPAIHHLTWNISRRALHAGLMRLRTVYQASDEEVQDIINTCNVKAARKCIERSKALYMYMLERDYGYTAGPAVELAYATIMNGVEHVVSDPDDIEKNWCLTDDEEYWKAITEW
jgi:hypothetical protein